MSNQFNVSVKTFDSDNESLIEELIKSKIINFNILINEKGYSKGFVYGNCDSVIDYLIEFSKGCPDECLIVGITIKETGCSNIYHIKRGFIIYDSFIDEFNNKFNENFHETKERFLIKVHPLLMVSDFSMIEDSYYLTFLDKSLINIKSFKEFIGSHFGCVNYNEELISTGIGSWADVIALKKQFRYIELLKVI